MNLIGSITSETPARGPALSPAAIGGELLLRRLRAFAPLSAREASLVRALGDRLRTHAPGSPIGGAGDGAPLPGLIVSGWASRQRMLLDGRRQIIAVLLPGDLVGARGHTSPLALTPVVALTAVRTVNATALVQALTDSELSGLARAVAALSCAEEAQLLDHVVRLGSQGAMQRVANFLLELHGRLTTIGFTHEDSFPMPLTQETLADLLGLSLVHINRIIRLLKREGLIDIRGGVARVHDYPRLAQIADHAKAD